VPQVCKGVLELGSVFAPDEGGEGESTARCWSAGMAKQYEIVFKAVDGSRLLLARASSADERVSWLTQLAPRLQACVGGARKHAMR
jgi:hypothetical protein